MGTTTNHYDLIVLGSDIAGLVSAALVARRGKRVLVIPHGHADGAYKLGGRSYALDTAPVIHMGCGIVRRVFQELGLLQQVRREHSVIEGLVHLVLRGHRLDIEPRHANFGDEAKREWPDDPVEDAWALQGRWRAATDEVLDELLTSENALVADGFWSRRFLTRVASELPARDVDDLEPLDAEHPMRIAARAVEPWLLHLAPDQLGKAASLRIGGLWQSGPEDLPAGSRRLREVLIQRIELHSGEVKRELRVAEVLVRRGRVTGVSLLGKRDRYGCDHMIVSTDPHRLLDGPLTGEHLPRPLVSTLAAIRPVAHRFVMHLEIEELGLSPGLAGMAICAPDPETGAGLTYLRLGAEVSESSRLVSITRIVGADESLDDLRDRVLSDLDKAGVLPFARRYVRLIHSPHDGREATDRDGNALADTGPATEMTVPMEPIYASDDPPSLGAGMLPQGSGIKNLYFAGRLTLPGLGLEGEFLAGLTAAAQVAGAGRTPLSRTLFLRRA